MPFGRYQYDALYRLVLAEGREHAGGNNSTTASDSVRRFWGMPYSNSPGDVRTYTQRYTYDEVGNMLQMRHMAAGGAGNWTRNYTMGTATNRLAGTSIGSDGTGSETYTYDSRGNIISGFNHLYEMVYNAENRLEQVTDAAGIVTCYQYDGSGQRVRKVTDTSGTLRRQRMYIGGWELYRETDPGTGTITTLRQTLNIMDDQTRIAIIDSSAIDSLVRYQYTNHLGTATLEVDEDTNVITYEEYYPYGSTAFTTTQSVMTTKRYRYIGMERDDESGFYYIGARYYCPWLAQWLAVDPINNEWYNMCKGVPQRNTERQFVEFTASGYEYCYANPVRFTDPNGEQATPSGNSTNENVISIIGRYASLRDAGFSPAGALVAASQKAAESGWKTSSGDAAKHNYFGMIDINRKKLTFKSDIEGAEAYMKMITTKFGDIVGLFKSSTFSSDNINKEMQSGPYINPGIKLSYNYDKDSLETFHVHYKDEKKVNKPDFVLSGMKNYGLYLLQVAKTGQRKYISVLEGEISKIDASIHSLESKPENKEANKQKITELMNQRTTLNKTLNEIRAINFTDSGTNISSETAPTTGERVQYNKNIENINSR